MEISKELLMLGWNAGIVHLIADPNMEFGTVCQIGEYWFYFGGKKAEEMNPEEYLKAFSKEQIVDEIFATLNESTNSGMNL